MMTSDGNSILINFVSDKSTTRKGFSLQYESKILFYFSFTLPGESKKYTRLVSHKKMTIASVI